MTHEEKLIEALQKLALIANRLIAQANLLQEQFNPETYEISRSTVDELEIALAELEAIEAKSTDASPPPSLTSSSPNCAPAAEQVARRCR